MCRCQPQQNVQWRAASLVVIMLLRATDCKYRESLESCKISLFILFFPKGPFDEPFSNIISKSFSVLCFLRKIEKFKIRLNGLLNDPLVKQWKIMQLLHFVRHNTMQSRFEILRASKWSFYLFDRINFFFTLLRFQCAQ